MNGVDLALSLPSESPVRECPASQADREVKRSRVLSILDAAGADSLLLTSQTALAWYLDGSRIHISLAGDPVAAVLVDRSGDTLLTFNNEAARIGAEELPAGVRLTEVPWHASLAEAARSIAGTALLAEDGVARELRDARRSLLPAELGRYEDLGRTAALALTDVLSAATPETTERQVAAGLAERLVAAGADPIVLLCSGASREAFRHPLPTGAPLGRRAMAVVCARRDGLIANATRWIRFDGSTPEERGAEERIAAVEADTLAATVPGAPLNAILEQIRRSYDAHGFGPDQWRLHHQGGPAGYAGRDPRATDATEDEVADNQAFSWNPSGPGVKVEDTIVLGSAGPRVLTLDPRWPVTDVAGVPRPATLQL